MNISELLEIENVQVINKQKILDDSEDLVDLNYILSSGARNFDETLGGGFTQGKKYLIFGANKSGKTQLCHQLCIQAYIQLSILNTKSDLMNKQFIFYFDTENTFRPERLKELIIKRNVDYNKLLKCIFVSKIMSNAALLLALKELERLLDINTIYVLIIDTLNNYYNSELANKEIASNKTKTSFLKVLKKINEITRKYRIITITTAQITSNLINKDLIRVIPVGNHLLNHFFSEYVYLDYKEQDKRYVQLVNSINLPEKRLLYSITSKGIQDYKI